MDRRDFCKTLAAMGAMGTAGIGAASEKKSPPPTPTPSQKNPALSDFVKIDTDPYTTEPYLEQRWNAVRRKLAFKAKTQEDWAAWREQAEARLKELLGLNTMQRAPLEASITEEVDCGDHRRQRVVIQTEPGILMPLFVLIPKQGTPPYPAVICPHGHGSFGKFTTAGLFCENPIQADTIEHYHYDYGVQFVRAGFIAFCHDARGFGERLEKQFRSQAFNQSCSQLNIMAYGLGQTVAGMWTWDIQRLVDYIESREDCKKGGVGCGGLSGGGLQTLYAAALEPRIKCGVISGYMASAYDYIFHGGCCMCNYVPHLWEYMDLGDTAAMIAPRALVVETGDGDLPGGMKGVMSQIEIIRRAYRLLGVEARFKHDIFAGGHMWHGVVSIPFMKNALA